MRAAAVAAVLALLGGGAHAADAEAQAKVRVNMRNGDRVTITVDRSATYEQIIDAATKRAGDDGLRSVSLVLPRAKRQRHHDDQGED